MKNNDMSFESLYSIGLGLNKNTNQTISLSTENYDGYEDGPAIELQQSIEALEYLDTFAKVESAMSDAKIRMCKKLTVNYGLKSGINATAANSIESLCRMQSTEAEDNGEKGDEKKKSFLKNAIEALKKVFEAISKLFRTSIDKTKYFFKMLFTTSPAYDVDVKYVKAILYEMRKNGKLQNFYLGSKSSYRFDVVNNLFSSMEELYNAVSSSSDKISEIDKKVQSNITYICGDRKDRLTKDPLINISSKKFTGYAYMNENEIKNKVEVLTCIEIALIKDTSLIAEVASKESSFQNVNKQLKYLIDYEIKFENLNTKSENLLNKIMSSLNLNESEKEYKRCKALKTLTMVSKNFIETCNLAFKAIKGSYFINRKAYQLSQKSLKEK